MKTAIERTLRLLDLVVLEVFVNYPQGNATSDDIENILNMREELLEQEKQQIKDAYIHGVGDCNNDYNKEAEDYYNETYLTNKNMETPNTKINLCDYCKLELPTCPVAVGLKFGDGLGDDNIIECSEFIHDTTKPMADKK